MPQDYNPAFNGADFMATTMTEVIDENCETLRSKFSELDASEPAQRREFQWWVKWETVGSLTELKIRNAANTAWIDIYDIENKLFIFETPGNITATDINDTARKPSIIDGEDINPNSCTLNSAAIGKQIALPEVSKEILTATNLHVVGSTGATVKHTSKIYIPFTPSGTSTLHVNVLINRLSAYCTLGGELSNTVTEASSTPTWHEMDCDFSALPSAGWYDFVLTVTTATYTTDPRFEGVSSHIVP